MHSFSSYFPIIDRYTYLNTPASGLLSKPVLDFRRQHDLLFFEGGSLFKEKQGDFLAEVREKVGQLFNCAPNRVALVPNFSYGFNTLLEGIAVNNTVLLLEEDYPSVAWPFISRDFEVNYVPIDAHLEDRIADAFAKAAPDIFAFSIVQYISGIKIDLDFIKDLKKQYPSTIFLADGTQFLGAAVFDFDTSGIDVLGGSCYKWMNAGYGNGIFLFKPEIVDRVAPKTTGFNALQGKYKPQEGSFIGHFEPGHQDTLNYGSLGTAIDFINTIGMSTIERRINELKEEAKTALSARGLLDEAVVGRKQHSSIFNIKGDATLVATLNEQDIICVQRGAGVRAGFHYFNSPKGLNKLLLALQTSKR